MPKSAPTESRPEFLKRISALCRAYVPRNRAFKEGQPREPLRVVRSAGVLYFLLPRKRWTCSRQIDKYVEEYYLDMTRHEQHPVSEALAALVLLGLCSEVDYDAFHKYSLSQERSYEREKRLRSIRYDVHHHKIRPEELFPTLTPYPPDSPTDD